MLTPFTFIKIQQDSIQVDYDGIHISTAINILSNSSASIHLIQNYRQIFVIFIIANSKMQQKRANTQSLCGMQYSHLHPHIYSSNSKNSVPHSLSLQPQHTYTKSLRYFIIKNFRVKALTLTFYFALLCASEGCNEHLRQILKSAFISNSFTILPILILAHVTFNIRLCCN